MPASIARTNGASIRSAYRARLRLADAPEETAMQQRIDNRPPARASGAAA
ncbi:hypothetical protein [Burkholderia gladioli]